MSGLIHSPIWILDDNSFLYLRVWLFLFVWFLWPSMEGRDDSRWSWGLYCVSICLILAIHFLTNSCWNSAFVHLLFIFVIICSVYWSFFTRNCEFTSDLVAYHLMLCLVRFVISQVLYLILLLFWFSSPEISCESSLPCHCSGWCQWWRCSNCDCESLSFDEYLPGQIPSISWKSKMPAWFCVYYILLRHNPQLSWYPVPTVWWYTNWLTI